MAHYPITHLSQLDFPIRINWTSPFPVEELLVVIFNFYLNSDNVETQEKGAQWLSGRVLDSRLRGCRFEPHRRHCVVSLSKNINPSLVHVQPWKTSPFLTERLLTVCLCFI